MGKLGYIMPVTRHSNVVTQQQQQPDPITNAMASLWNQIFLNDTNGSYLLSRFIQSPGWWRAILYSSSLTPVQKFQSIFGIALNQPANQLSGDIFSDVGNWISNLFSSQNLQNAELWLRQGEQSANNIANMLNAYRNQPSAQQQALLNMQQQNLISQGYFGASDFMTQYGTLIVIGLVILVLYLILKKK